MQNADSHAHLAARATRLAEELRTENEKLRAELDEYRRYYPKARELYNKLADELEKQRLRALYVINNGIDELVNESNSGRAHVRAVELLSELAEVLNGIIQN